MKPTLIGHGYIGQQIADYLKYQNLDFEHIHHTDPIPQCSSIIINAAGFTGYQNVDDCDKEVENTLMSNVAFPVKLSALPIPVIHLGTGCIFNHPTKIFNENDAPNFSRNTYALSRKVMEESLRPFMKKDFILRIRLPFDGSLNPKNLLSKLHKYHRLYDMFLGSMSYVPDVVRSVYNFIVDLPPPGIYNLTNPGEIHMKDIVQMMGWQEKQIIGKQPYNRCYCKLSSNKISLGHVIPAMEQACNDWKKNYSTTVRDSQLTIPEL